MSFPNNVKGEARIELGRKWGEASAVSRQKTSMETGVDADTMRRRWLSDSKGLLLREGCTYTATNEAHWEARRSALGSVKQVDLIVNGSLWRTGSARRVNSAIRWGKWSYVNS